MVETAAASPEVMGTAAPDGSHSWTFLKTVQDISELVLAAEEDYRLFLVNLSDQIIQKRINSGEARTSDFVAAWAPLTDALLGRKTENPGRFPKIMETSEERNQRLQQSYLEVRGTINEMRTSELLPLIGRLRRDKLLFEVLTSMPKKGIRNLYSIDDTTS